MNDWELIGIVAGGAIIGYFVLKSQPNILKNITEKLPSLAPPSELHDISWTPSQIPPPGVTPKGVCKPGEYLDQTDGILTCRSAGETKYPSRAKPHIGLLDPSPNLAPANPWNEAVAYGKTIDNDYWGYAKSKGGSNIGSCPPGVECHKSPGGDQVGIYPNRTNTHWLEVPGGIFGPGFAVQTRDNYTQPLVQPDPNKAIEDQIKKKHKKKKDTSIIDEKYPSKIKKEYDPHKKKLAEVPSGGISVQMECPHDLSLLNCGAHCTKNGKVYQVVCGAIEKPPKHHKTPTRPRPPPSLTVPPNFPGAVTISPGETPYPEQTDTSDQTDVSGTPVEGGDMPNLGEPQHDTSGVITTPPTPLPHRQPEIGPPTREPHRQPQINQPFPSSGQAVAFSSGGGCNTKDGWESCRSAIGCMKNGSTSSEDGGQRNQPVSKFVGNSFYAIWDFSANWKKGKVSGAEVTGGYYGSNNNFPEVGITIGVYPDGKIKTRTEDHYAPNHKQRAKGDYNDLATGVGIKNVQGFSNIKDFSIVWCADKSGSDVTYRGYLRFGGREVQIANLRNPPEGGDGSGSHHDNRRQVVDFTQHNGFMRGRMDSGGMNNIPKGKLYNGSYKGSFYSGPLGYMED